MDERDLAEDSGGWNPGPKDLAMNRAMSRVPRVASVSHWHRSVSQDRDGGRPAPIR